eukprot:7317366-Prymnesium_polylepis.1
MMVFGRDHHTVQNKSGSTHCRCVDPDTYITATTNQPGPDLFQARTAARPSSRRIWARGAGRARARASCWTRPPESAGA